VFACYFGDDEPTLLSDETQEIQPLKMICGTRNEAYFVIFDPSVGYQIVQARFANHVSSEN
jgi:hypothetical protein